MKVEEIKAYMKAHNITQIELSEKSKIPLQTIRKIFSGHTANPRIDTLCAIEQALGLGGEKEYREATSLSDKQRRLLSAFDKLVPAMQDNVIGIVENLAEQTVKRGVS